MSRRVPCDTAITVPLPRPRPPRLRALPPVRALPRAPPPAPRRPPSRSRAPDGHVFELYHEGERYDAPEPLRPALKTAPGRYPGRGCAVKRLDHINVRAGDVRANREFCVDALGYRLYER